MGISGYLAFIIPPPNEVGGGVYWIHLVRPSVRLSVCPSGYEELSTDTNYPIWRRQKLPYMKKTRKKKQVCGAACFMAAEIKFSEDVRPSVCRRHGFRSISQVCFGISISNFICMLIVAIGRSLLIFSDVTFKMAAWLAILDFLVSGL